MTTAVCIKTAVCAKYERLLEECQSAWKVWNEERSEIHRSHLRGKNSDDQLRNLQAKYAKAYAHLRNHLHGCETCQWVSRIERQSSNRDLGVVPARRAYAQTK